MKSISVRGISRKVYKSNEAKNEEERCKWPWSKCPSKIKKGNRFLCPVHSKEHLHAIPTNDYFGFGRYCDSLKKVAAAVIEEMRDSLSKAAIILTTSPQTKLTHPNAIIVSQRYARHYLNNKTVNFFPAEG